MSALAGCGSPGASSAPKETRTRVETVEARYAAAPGSVRASGVVAYLREPVLSFKVGGVVAEILVDEGDRVAKGQRLAWLRPAEVEAGAAEAAAALETAERALARAQTLFDKGLVAQARLDDAKLAVERARAGSSAAAFNRDTSIILAPADGVVLRRAAEPAQTVGAGAPILVVGETSSGVVIRAAVASSEAVRLKPGDAGVVSIGESRYAAKITRLSAKSDAATGAFDVEVRIAAPQGLRSGMVAQVQLEGAPGGPKEGVIRLPTLALLDARADQGVVFVVGADGRVERRAVRTGGVDQEHVLILGGLSPGEIVVAAGAAYLSDGAPVEIAARR
jgi:membrane fusion protein (multidrug efflux system)